MRYLYEYAGELRSSSRTVVVRISDGWYVVRYKPGAATRTVVVADRGHALDPSLLAGSEEMEVAP